MKPTPLTNSHATAIVLTIIAFLVRLILWPLSDVVEADATTRIFEGEALWNNMHWITSGVWLPLHAYINAFTVGIFNSRMVAPFVLHMLMAAGCLWPISYFLKKQFKVPRAEWVAFFIVMSPYFMRFSFQPLSSIPFLFFLSYTLAFLAKAIASPKNKWLLLAGICMTLSCGFRYEAWMIFALLTGLLALYVGWKKTLVFWLAAMVVPAYWMIGNYLENGDLFSGLTGAYDWNVVMEGVQQRVKGAALIERILYFPLAIFFFYVPFGLVRLIRRKKDKFLSFTWDKKNWIWAIPFIVFLITFIFKSINGTLLLKQRFIGILIITSLPLVAFWCKKIDFKPWKSFAAILLAWFFSYYGNFVQYEKVFLVKAVKNGVKKIRINNISDCQAIPNIPDNYMYEIADHVRENSRNDEGFIVDFLNWERTYYLSLNSNYEGERIFRINGAMNAAIDYGRMEKLVQEYPRGYMVLDEFSKWRTDYKLLTNGVYFPKIDQQMKLEKIMTKHDITLYRYTALPSSNDKIELEQKPIDTPTYYINHVWRKKHLINTVYKDVFVYQKSLDHAVTKKAEELYKWFKNN